jgi:hypothetical protein
MEDVPMPPLPEGLSVCAECGAVRGHATAGGLSVCYCQGVICNWCGARLRRPISDYYEPRSGRWLHVPYFALGGHGCQAPAERKVGKHFTTLPIVEQDLLEYRERMTQRMFEQMYGVPPRRIRTPH